MLKRTWASTPAIPAFAPDLDSLGFKVNDNGQIVKKATGEFFTLHITDNEKLNIVRREAFREGARKEIRSRLAGYEVKEIFLTGPDGDDVQNTKPFVPHISILATDPKILKQKEDVIVIIPDRDQELGVVAYREVSGPAGIESGSILGLVKKTQGMKLRVDKETEIHDPAFTTHVENSAKGASIVKDFALEDTTPGILVLNPGELVYSHKRSKCMSEQSWQNQSGGSALAGSPQISMKYNRVKGHMNPEGHVRTVLGKVLPHLLRRSAHVYVISLEAGAEYLVKYMATRLSNPYHKMLIPGRIAKALAFMEPAHNPQQVTTELAMTKINALGKSWMISEHPLGTVLAQPKHLEGVRVYEKTVISDPIPIPKMLKKAIQAGRDRGFTLDVSVLTARPPRDGPPWPGWLSEKATPPDSPTKAKEFEDKQELANEARSISPRDPAFIISSGMSGRFIRPVEELSDEQSRKFRDAIQAIKEDDVPALSDPANQVIADNTVRSRFTSPRGSEAELSRKSSSKVELTREVFFKSAPRHDQRSIQASLAEQSTREVSHKHNKTRASIDSNEQAVYSDSECSEEEEVSGKLIGGDFDDDGTEGLRMKDCKTTFRFVGSLPGSSATKNDAGEFDEVKDDPSETTKCEAKSGDTAATPDLEPDYGSDDGSNDGGIALGKRRNEAAVSMLEGEGHSSGDDGDPSGGSPASLNSQNLAEIKAAAAKLHRDCGHPDHEGYDESHGTFRHQLVRESDSDYDADGEGANEDAFSEEGDHLSDDWFTAPETNILDLGSYDNIDDSQALEQLDGAQTAPEGFGLGVLQPEVADMWRVSSGQPNDGELIFSAVVDDVLRWFQEMAKKSHV